MHDRPIATMRAFPPSRCLAGGGILLLAVLLAAGCDRAQRPAADAPGESVYRGVTTRIRGFDPVKVGDVPSTLAVAKIYEGLYQYAYLDRPYRLEPLLADGMPEISSNGLVCVIHLRRGIFFQDDPCFVRTGGRGREVTAADFVYAIERVADLRNASTGFWAFEDRIEGLDAWRARTANPSADIYNAPVAGLQTPDPATLVIRLTRPYPQLSWVLAMHYAAVVPREAVERYGAGFAHHPVGTGPFVLAGAQPNYRYEYARNPKWRATGRVERYPATSTDARDRPGLLRAAGAPLPFLDRVVEYVVDDPSTQWLMFLSGDLDSTAVANDNWDAVVRPDGLAPELRRKDIRLDVSSTLFMYYIGFNMEDRVVGTNRALRQALACAFDTAQYLHFFQGRIHCPNGPIPAGLPGHLDGPPRWAFDLDRARQLLRTAGYPDGVDPATGRRLRLTLEVGTAQNPEVRQKMDLFAQFMERIGVVVQPGYNNWQAFMDKIERRQAQLFYLSWVADYPDAGNYLQCFYGPNRAPGPNRANYANPVFDRLFEQAQVLPDGPERTALYRRMAGLVDEDCPWIPVEQPLAFDLRHGWLENYKHHDFPCGMTKYWRVDAGKRRGGGQVGEME